MTINFWESYCILENIDNQELENIAKKLSSMQTKDIISKYNLNLSNNFLGASYILPSGEILNCAEESELKLKNKNIYNIHDDIIDYIISCELNDYELAKTIDSKKIENLLFAEKGWIKINSGDSKFERTPYCVISSTTKPTQAQYDTIIKFIDYLIANNKKTIEFNILDNLYTHSTFSHIYRLIKGRNFFDNSIFFINPDDIIKDIKRSMVAKKY